MRLIDADAYSAEMKISQDACKKWMDDADHEGNDNMINMAHSAFSVFIEAKLTLDNMPTIDAVPVVKCVECKYGSQCLFGSIECKVYSRIHAADWFCAGGERKDNEGT